MAVPSMTAVLCHCLQPHEMRSLYSVLLGTTVQGTVTGYYLTASINSSCIYDNSSGAAIVYCLVPATHGRHLITQGVIVYYIVS